MQGKKNYSEKLFTSFQLSERVPEDNFYRLINTELDLRFLYKETAQYYGTEGQVSIDPVVFFKLMLVGYLENINSDRRIIAFASMRLDILLFIGYDIDEPLPWHSTLSRTRQLYGESVFLKLFQKVLSMCISKGMVRGKRQAIDSAFIKANASLDSLIEKPVHDEDAEAAVMDDAKDFATELNQSTDAFINAPQTVPIDKSKDTITSKKHKEVTYHHSWKSEEYKDQPGHQGTDRVDEFGNLIRPRYLSNHTHYSPSDPDSRIAVKPGKARQMNYYAQIAVDDSFHVITGAVADYADKRDSECLPFVLEHTIQNLAQEQIKVEQIVADTAYSSGEALEYCEQNNIEPFIPNFGQYKSEREGFIYNKEKDQYECQRGNKAVLPLKRTGPNSSGYMMKVYRSSETVCKNCPLRKSCIGEKTKFKKIDNSIFKPHYDKMHAKLQTMHAKRILKKRSSTVEPVLGTMINFLNLKRTNARGIKQAMKHVLMSALVYNLKKYINFVTRKRISVPVAIDFRCNFNIVVAVFNIFLPPHSLATNSIIKN